MNIILDLCLSDASKSYRVDLYKSKKLGTAYTLKLKAKKNNIKN